MQRLLVSSRHARLVEKTKSGHNIHAYSPRLVIDAIREVVESVQAVELQASPMP